MKTLIKFTGCFLGLGFALSSSLTVLAQEAAKTSDQIAPEATSSYVAPVPGEGLKMELDDKGVKSLKYNGEE